MGIMLLKQGEDQLQLESQGVPFLWHSWSRRSCTQRSSKGPVVYTGSSNLACVGVCVFAALR